MEKIEKSDQKSRINTLHRRFAFYGRSAREWTRKCAMLLPEIEREQVWEKKGFGSVYEYAARLAGMSRESVNDALRVLRATEGMKEIREVIAQRGINAIKPVITALTPDNESFWAEKAQTMSRHTLETYVREMKAQNEVSCATQNIVPAGRTGPSKNLDLPVQQAILVGDIATEQPTQKKRILIMDLDPMVASELEKLKGQNEDWNSLMKEFLQMRAKEIERETKEIQEEQRTSPVQSPTSRHIPAQIRHHVIRKTRGQCAYPSCTKQYKILHHTQRFALERVHDPERIAPLCKAHERLAHLGLIDSEEKSANEWNIREQPDVDDPKYTIDQKVQRFRMPK